MIIKLDVKVLDLKEEYSTDTNIHDLKMTLTFWSLGYKIHLVTHHHHVMV